MEEKHQEAAVRQAKLETEKQRRQEVEAKLAKAAK
jgi:hypothetical protein